MFECKETICPVIDGQQCHGPLLFKEKGLNFQGDCEYVMAQSEEFVVISADKWTSWCLLC